MELRPVQTALLAGRAVSRWATSTSSTTTASKSSIPLSLYASTLSRPFSTTRPRLQEAEATAPFPTGGMAGVLQERAQSRTRQQQQQQQISPVPQQQDSQAVNSNSIFAPGPSPLSSSSAFEPWERRHSNAQVVPHSAGFFSEVTEDLGLGNYAKPTAADIERQKEAMFYEKPIDVKYRLRPVIGRTIDLTIGSGMDLAKGLARLDTQCKANRVRADTNRQRFHERKGLKKKRLRSERWRQRFMGGFRATCKRVNELAKQGW